jgi:hypothetical protein
MPLCIIIVLALLCAGSAKAAELRLAHTLSGRDSQYTVQERDSFDSIGSRFGAEPSLIAFANGFETKEKLPPR